MNTYVIINNGVDTRFKIIMNEQTGYFNITKTAKLFKDVEKEEFQASGTENQLEENSPQVKYCSQRGKLIKDWFRNRDVKEKVAECERLNNLRSGECCFTIRKGELKYQGTYIHPMLYDHFMAWLSPKYSMRVSAILRTHHEAANMKVLAQKDVKIDMQSKKIDTLISDIRELKDINNDQTAKMDDQNAKIAELLSYGKNIQEELGEVREEVMDVKHHYGNLYDVFEDVHDEMVSTKKTVKKVADHLEEKSFASTMNPDPEGLHHNALVMFKKIGQNYTVNNIAGQSAYVNTRKTELEIDGFTTMIDKFYQANPIDFRRNVQQAVNGHIDKVLEPLNAPIIAAREALKREIDEHNLMLQEDIPQSNERLAERVRVFNLTATGRDVIRLVSNGARYAGKYNKTFARVRFYENEMRKYKMEVRNPKYKLKTLPIKVCSRFIVWRPNSMISFETLKALIHDVNKKTQKSPYQSDDE